MNGGIFLPFLSSQSCRQREREREIKGTAAMSSSMMFYAGMEKERGRDKREEKRERVFFSHCVCTCM